MPVVAAPDQADSFAARFAMALSRLPIAGRRIAVALSGGLDSTLLLDALHESGVAGSLRVIHIDHGLHPDSSEWSGHCRRQAQRLGLEFIDRRVMIAQSTGQSLEAEARRARYQAFAEIMARDEVVVTAHHADDQLETVLLRLLRGTGVSGLTAIHASVAFGPGRLVRPLLDFSRADIEAEALHRGLSWLEDPSNAELRFDRNYLRARVLPALFERWPGAGRLANRLARQMDEAEAVLADQALTDLGGTEDPGPLAVDRLVSLSAARQRNALRYAIRLAGLPTPTAAQLGEIERALDARQDASPCVCWPGGEARVYRRRLYLMAPGDDAECAAGRVAVGEPFVCPHGELSLVPAEAYGIPDQWARSGLEVSFRVGGERFRPEGREHSQSLKHWFQEAGVVPWMRSTVPLLHHDGALIGVGDLCLAAGMPQSPADGPFWQPRVRPPGLTPRSDPGV